MTAGTGYPPPDWTRTDPDVLASALDQAFPYQATPTIPSVAEAAWSARVQAAVNGMDVVDPAGMDAWMETHGQSAEPWVEEARLAATYETYLREVIEAEFTWEEADAALTGQDDIDSM